MYKKGIVVFSLLWLLSGCIRKPNDVDMYQRAIGSRGRKIGFHGRFFLLKKEMAKQP